MTFFDKSGGKRVNTALEGEKQGGKGENQFKNRGESVEKKQKETFCPDSQ